MILLSCDDKGDLPVETRHVSTPMRMARVMAIGRMKRPMLRRERRPIADAAVLGRGVPILKVLGGHEEVFSGFLTLEHTTIRLSWAAWIGQAI